MPPRSPSAFPVRSRWAASAAVAAAFMALFVLLVGVAGGTLTVVATTGNSMEPGLRHGDLVVVRSVSRYEVGDVTAYRSELLDTVVLHRIVDRDEDGFVLQGDNNDFLDAERPTEEDLIGRTWVRLPAGARITAWMRQPATFAGLVAAGAVVGAGRVGARRRRAPGAQPRRPFMPRRIPTIWSRRLAQILAAIGLALVVVGGIALTRSTMQPVSRSISFTHQGEFSYDAPVPSSPAYPHGLRTGDPVYRQMTDRLEIRFTYRLAGTDAHVDGTATLAARLVAANAWERELELGTPSDGTGEQLETAAVVRLAELDSAAAEMANLTGIPAATLRVVVEATVEVDGTVEGHPVEDRFVAPMTFSLDELQFRPAGDEPGPFTSTAPGSVAVPGTEPAQLSALGVDADVSLLRLAGPAGLAMLVVAALCWWSSGRHLRTESDRIAASHGHLLVPVSAAEPAPAGAVEVGSFDALLRLARHHDLLILDHAHGRDHTYMVETTRTLYRYTPREPTRIKAPDTQ